jgi:hypothetical protein
MLAETARRRSRGSKFKTRVLVMSRSSRSRSLSVCSSGLGLAVSREVNGRSGIGEDLIIVTDLVKSRDARLY